MSDSLVKIIPGNPSPLIEINDSTNRDNKLHFRVDEIPDLIIELLLAYQKASLLPKGIIYAEPEPISRTELGRLINVAKRHKLSTLDGMVP